MPTNDVEITVVVPAYNAEQWIEETLLTVLAQDYDPAKMFVIIVDDGSTDNTVNIARKILSESSLKHTIIQTENGGASHARNIGWQNAKSEWIQFLDADDLLHPQKITCQILAAQDTAPDVAVLYSAWQRLVQTPEGKWILSQEICSPNLTEDVTDLLDDGNFIQLSSAMMRRSWLEQVAGFDENMGIVQDVNLMLRIAFAGGKFQYVMSNSTVSYYRQLKNSLSKRDQGEFIRDCLQNTIETHQWIETHGSMTQKQVHTLLSAYLMIAHNSYRRDSETFETAYAALRRLSPGGRYVPSNPEYLKLASLLVGYRNAELLVGYYQSVKQRLRSGAE